VSTWDDDLYVGEIVPDHFLEGPLHFVSQHIEGALGVIGFAVVPNELDVVKDLLDSAVLSGL
jgi:hypothetical protein